MMIRVTRSSLTTQHQTCKTKTTMYKTKSARPRPCQCARPRLIFLVSDQSCPKTDCLRPYHWISHVALSMTLVFTTISNVLWPSKAVEFLWIRLARPVAEQQLPARVSWRSPDRQYHPCRTKWTFDMVTVNYYGLAKSPMLNIQYISTTCKKYLEHK